MGTIGVDFDGVIHRYSLGWNGGDIYDEPVVGAFSALKKLMDRYAVFIHTTRDPKPVGVWLNFRGNFDVHVDQLAAPFAEFWDRRGVLLVTQRKYPALAYIDDRALLFTNWRDAMAEIGRRERIWKK